MVTILSIAAGPIATSEAVRCVKKSALCRSTRLSSASSSRPWRRIRSRLRLPQLGSLRKRAASSNGNGRCDASALATRPSGRVANMTLSSLRIASLRARSSAPGKRSCALSKLSSRNMRAGGRKNRSSSALPSAQPCKRSGREPAADLARPHHLGGRSKAHPAFCHTRSRSRPENGHKVRCGSRSFGKREQTSEHRLQRRVHTYRDYIDVERLRQRITELNGAGKMDKEIAAILNQEGFVAARGCAFKGENVWLLRTRWGIPTVKINGVSANPMRWPDGSFSIQGVAAELGITPQTVFDYLARGLLTWTPADEGTAVANRTLGGSDQSTSRSRATHEALQEGGIMKASPRRCCRATSPSTPAARRRRSRPRGSSAASRDGDPCCSRAGPASGRRRPRSRGSWCP